MTDIDTHTTLLDGTVSWTLRLYTQSNVRCRTVAGPIFGVNTYRLCSDIIQWAVCGAHWFKDTCLLARNGALKIKKKVFYCFKCLVMMSIEHSWVRLLNQVLKWSYTRRCVKHNSISWVCHEHIDFYKSSNILSPVSRPHTSVLPNVTISSATGSVRIVNALQKLQ